MTPARKRRVMVIAFILIGAIVAVSLLLVALGNNMNGYYELKLIRSGAAPIEQTIRVGGIVKKGSLHREKGTLNVSFIITDLHDNLNVKYQGILPDLFKEGQGVLAKGKLMNQQTFIAQEILAKHDENYLPKEVQAELEQSGYFEEKIPESLPEKIK